MLFTALSIQARFELLRNSFAKLSTFCEPQVPSYKGGNTTNLLLGLLGEFRGYKTHKSTIRVPDKEPDFFSFSPLISHPGGAVLRLHTGSYSSSENGSRAPPAG